jgi:hypothetical protein
MLVYFSFSEIREIRGRLLFWRQVMAANATALTVYGA